MSIPDTVRVLIAGDSGSGKTTRAWGMYGSKFPRRIIVDQTGEWGQGRPLSAITRVDAETVGTAEGIAAIQRLAPRGQWTVVIAPESDDDFSHLVRWLIPVPDLPASPIRVVGGAAIIIDEVDLVAPSWQASVEIRSLYRRSRHVGLSVISATTRPANVSREVSAQSTHIIAHRLSEPRDRDYIVNAMRWSPQQAQVWQEWVRDHPHGAVWKDVQTGRMLLLPENGKPQPYRETA